MGLLETLFRIDGKIAVVSDAGSLSSIDVAPMLAAAGATVVVADKEPEAVKKLVDEIKASGGNAVGIPTDVESESSVEALFAGVKEQFGRCDIEVNCAGITVNGPFAQTSMEHYESMHSVNQRSTFMMMRAAVNLMLETGSGGRIVNITTIGAWHPVLKGNVGYGATRASVTAMTRACAYDHAKDGILCNLVMPGAVVGKTKLHPDLLARLQSGGKMEGPGSDLERRLPLGMGNGRDIAAAVLYLVGPSGSYLTGQSITLDGGFLST